MKVTISLNDDLVKRIDKNASENYLTRSGLISVACASYLNSFDLVSSFNDLTVSIRKIADTGIVDDDVLKSLEDFERLSKIYLK